MISTDSKRFSTYPIYVTLPTHSNRRRAGPGGGWMWVMVAGGSESATVAVLIFLARTAGTGVVAVDARPGLYRLGGSLSASGTLSCGALCGLAGKVFARGLIFRVVLAALGCGTLHTWLGLCGGFLLLLYLTGCGGFALGCGGCGGRGGSLLYVDLSAHEG